MKIFFIMILFCYAGLFNVSAISYEQFKLSDPIVQIENQYFYALDSPCTIAGESILVNGEINQEIYSENTVITSIERIINGESVREEVDLQIIYDIDRPNVYARIETIGEKRILHLSAKDDYYVNRIVYSEELLEKEMVLASESFFNGDTGEIEVNLDDHYYCYGIDESNNISEALEITIVDDHDSPVIESIEYLSGESLEGVQGLDTMDLTVQAHDEISNIYSISLLKEGEVLEESMGDQAEFHIIPEKNINYSILVRDLYGNDIVEDLFYEIKEEKDVTSSVFNIEVWNLKPYSNIPVIFEVSAKDENLAIIECYDNGNVIPVENNNQISFTQEGHHSIYFEARDQAGNSITSDLYEFEIDMTPPVIRCDYSEGPFSNHTIIVDFEIEEKNLDMISANLDYIENIYNGNIVLSMVLNNDQYYVPAITVTDLAGNVCTYSLSEILIDQTLPIISIEGVTDGENYQDLDTIHISVHDDHLTTSSAIMKNLTENIQIEGNQIITDQDHYYDFQLTSLSDGNYELTIWTIDQMGNVQTDVCSFTKNSHGSKYAIHANNDQIEIVESNLNQVENTTILINCNGNTILAKENDDYQVTLEKGLFNEYIYTYQLNSDLFSQDGNYILTIYSKDEAGNVNQKTLDQFEIEVKENEVEIVLLDHQSAQKDVETKDQVEVYIDGQKAEINTESKEDDQDDLSDLEIIEAKEEEKSLENYHQQKMNGFSYLSGALLGVLMIGTEWRRKHAIKGRNK